MQPHQQMPIANSHRTPEYIKLLHSIRSCTNSAQLETLRETVLRYHKEDRQDAPELLAEFMVRVDDLDEPLHTPVP